MNHLFFGRSGDMNIGNGKTVSAIRLLFQKHLLEDKIIFSNIKLNDVEYIELTPDNICEVIETQDAVVLLDELHAIFDIHHKISPTCKHHQIPGTCYEVSELFRQVRKLDITTISTVQSYSDCVYRLKVVMQENIVCEKYDVSQGQFQKCQLDNCPGYHDHRIKQTNIRNGIYNYFDPKPYYDLYDSSEVVSGWQNIEAIKPKKKKDIAKTINTKNTIVDNGE